MYKILSKIADEQEVLTEIEKVSPRYPVELRSSVREAFQAAKKQDFKKSVELCYKLLDCVEDFEIRMLLGNCYFMQGEMQSAKQVFTDLTMDYPEVEEYCIYLGMTEHALGNFAEAVRVLGRLYPLKVYRPFYYTSYGESLLQMGRQKQSCEAFREDVRYFEKTKTIVLADMLDGAFQNLLYLDITLGNGKYPEDVKLYYDFLERTEMTEEMQKYLSGNIVEFCHLMSNKWYQPLFLEFITYVRNRGFLTYEEPLEVLESAFTSWESYAYHEDRQISALMEAYMAANYKRKYTKDILLGAENNEIEVTALTYDWYMCQYALEYPAEIDYVRESYPYTYADNSDFFEKVKCDAKGTAEKVMSELYPYTRRTSRQEFNESMYRAYKRACANKKEPVYAYDGMETYRRIQPKVGRNDPCPCGSGKKYKKCCGR